jgi:hypothetical protein
MMRGFFFVLKGGNPGGEVHRKTSRMCGIMKESERMIIAGIFFHSIMKISQRIF